MPRLVLSKSNISKGVWAWIFFFISLEPAAFQHFALTNRIFDLLQLGMFLCVFCFWIRMKKKSKINYLLILYYTYLIIITFINLGRTQSIIMQAIHFIGFTIYLEIVLFVNPKEIFRSALSILTFYLLLNFAIILSMPSGLYATLYYTNNYLLGYDNQNINFILPTLILVLLKNEYDKKCKMQIIFTYAIAALTAIAIWSGMTLIVVSLTSVVGLLMIRGSKGLGAKILNAKVFNFRNLLIINVAAFIGLVFFRIQHYFEYFIVFVLKKNVTLTSRTYIWDRTIRMIKENPLWGYGKEVYANRAIKTGYRENSPAGLHAHNRFLETQYSGGVILSLIYGLMLITTANNLHKVKDCLYAKVISMGLFIYMVGMLTEFYDYCIFFWGFMIMAEFAERFDRGL